MITPYRVFISHSSQDNQFGLKLAQELRQALGGDETVWYDASGNVNGLPPGVPWLQKIEDEIAKCMVFLIIVSHAAMESTWTRHEYDMASHEHKIIIPLYYKQCDNMWLGLKTVQRIDFLHAVDYTVSFNELLKRLDAPIGMETKGAIGEQPSLEERTARLMTPVIKEAFDKKNWPDVINLTNMLVNTPQSIVLPEIYHMRGVAFLEQGSLQEADEALYFALALVSDKEKRLASLEAHTRVLRFLGQRWDEVFLHAKEALRLAPTNNDWRDIRHEAFEHLEQDRLRPLSSDTTGSLVGLGNSQPAAAMVRTYRGHSKCVYEVAWSHDSRYLASASGDGTVCIWEVNEIRDTPKYVYRDHSTRVNAVAWSPVTTDSIASAGNDKTVRIWKPGLGELFSWKHQDWVNVVAWSPDGTRIASAADDKTVQVWDCIKRSLVLIYTQHKHWVNAVSWSPDGTRIASASSDKTVQIWDATTGHQLVVYDRHTQGVNDLIWSPTGAGIASASNDKTVQLWSAHTGASGYIYKQHPAEVLSLARSPHGRRIASTTENNVYVWYAATCDDIFTSDTHVGWVRTVAWSPDGKYIASAGEDKTIQILNVKDENAS